MKIRRRSYLLSIPVELLGDIVARVASYSLTDYFNIQMSCKKLEEVANDVYVYKHVSFYGYKGDVWDTREKSKYVRFVEQCAAKGNPEALYRRGIVKYFVQNDLDIAMEYLEKSANSGHIEACYIISIILIYSGEEKGATLLSTTKKSIDCRKNIKFYRKKLDKLISWRRWKIGYVPLKRPICCTKNHTRKRKNPWDPEESEEEDYLFCDSCLCDREINLLSCF